MADYNYITTTGIIVPDTAVVQAQVIAEFKQVFGEGLDTSPQTIQGALIVAETSARVAVLRNNALMANQLNPNLAGGIFLDAIGKLTETERNAQTFTVASVNVTGVPSVVIPVNSSAKDADGNIYVNTATITLDSDGNGTGTFRSIVSGPLQLLAGTLTIIVQGPLGWETIINPGAGTQGSITQSDEAFRLYRRNTLAIQGSSLALGIKAAVYMVMGVLSLKIQENVANITQVINGITMVAHSIYLCVDGGTNLAVATAILSKKSGGCNYNGSTVVPVIEPASGQTFDITFDRPTLIPILAKVTISSSYTVSDPTDVIVSALLSYINGDLNGETGFTVGTDVSPFELGGAVSILSPTIFVRKVECSLASPISYSTDIIPIGVNQKATATADSISVVII